MPRPTPFEEVQRRLRPLLGARVDSLPQKWERLGDVLVLRLRDVALAPEETAPVAEVYGAVVGARVVLEDVGGITGALRTPQVRRLWGDGPTVTELRQDGIRYRLDPARVMFSSGNLEERQRMGRVAAAGETVVDLFAGIGYFTLPLLVHAGAARVIACELNPESAAFLRDNGVLNGVSDRLEVLEGDCRVVAPQGAADRVVSGYFPGGFAFLPTALAALRADGGVVHYHDTAKVDDPEGELLGHMEAAVADSDFELADHGVRVVKSHSPGVVHAVLDAHLVPEGAA